MVDDDLVNGCVFYELPFMMHIEDVVWSEEDGEEQRIIKKGKYIKRKDFVSKIKEIADKYDFDRSKLLIEITEDSIEKNMDVARNNIIKTKELGFSIALDDIGSGYTSLISLCEYPIDVVKIDRDVLLLSDRESGKKLFLGIISLIHSLNLKVVCEGVETEEQNTLVSESDCDYIQGWYYSKALPESLAEDFYKEYMKKF